MFIMVIIVILVIIVTHRVVVDFPGQGGGEHLGSLAKTEILQFLSRSRLCFSSILSGGENDQHPALIFRIFLAQQVYNRILLSV